MPDRIHHALVLNLHQPHGNLDALRRDPETEHEPAEILCAYDRIPRAVQGYEDVARVHLAMSGSLLEILSNPEFQARYYGTVKLGDLLWQLRNPAIDLLGGAYYHPVLPLITASDRAEQLARWHGIGRHLFERSFSGFWPPELGFSMEMIPLLKQYGYRYVIVDSEQIVPLTPMRWEEIRYRPHIARFGEDEIVIIPRDRDLSIAQESGMGPGWFVHELQQRTEHCAFVPLVCTATDGENGGWFRNTRWASNFWGGFYQPLCDQIRVGEANGVTPVHIDAYLDEHGAHGEVLVRTGAWNTGDHDGVGFVQWTGSQAQKDTWARQTALSQAIHDARWLAGERGWPDPEQGRLLEEAMWRLLRAEESCNFFWGEAWLDRCHADLDGAAYFLRLAEARNPETSTG